MYNLKKLVKITVNDFYVSRQYNYQKCKTVLGITVKSEGVQSSIWNSFMVQKFQKVLFLTDSVLYEKPEVTLYYESGIEKTYIFDTFKEAQEFGDKIKELSGGTFIS